MAVGHLLGAVHQHLRTVIQLRGAVDGEQQRQCLLESERVSAISQEAVGVMVLDECHHT